MNKEIIIDQTVHGYSEGHRLLAVSCQLSSREQRILLEISDLSGDIVRGFDEYLTGYPLPESKYYALAKTWYAPEMDRPGCVWTHTLLIKRIDFRHLINTHPLRSLFVRPQKGKPYTAYKESIAYQFDDDCENDFIFPQITPEASSDYSALYSILFRQLYEKVKSPVLLARDSLQFEELVLSLWCQQWPSLRSRFTFCTGSLSTRTIHKRPFIFQVAPYQNSSLFAKRYPNVVLIDPKSADIEKSKISYRVDHRTFRHKHDPLLRFVWHYGSQMEPLRKNFGWLAKFFTLIDKVQHKEDNLTKVTDHLASKFPSPDEMPDLKAKLYGGKTDEETYVQPLSDEVSLLMELLQTEHLNIFDIEKLDIFKRTGDLWHHSSKAVIDIASTYSEKINLNPISREFFRALANHLTPREAYKLGREKQAFLLQLLDFNPQLAATAEIWNENNQVRNEIFLLLSRISQNHTTPSPNLKWREIVYSMLEAGSDNFIEPLDEILGDHLVTFILDWHAQTENNKIFEGRWSYYLQQHSTAAMEWVVNTKGSLQTKAVITTIQSPHSLEVVRHGSFPWLELTEGGTQVIPKEYLVQVMGFLLTLGFKNIDEGAIKLVAASFQVLYDAALTHSLPMRTWTYLERLAPSGALLFEWDKCQRLEEALVSKIIDYGWP